MVAEIKNNLPAVVFMVAVLVSVNFGNLFQHRKLTSICYLLQVLALTFSVNIVDTVCEYMLALVFLKPRKHLPSS